MIAAENGCAPCPCSADGSELDHRIDFESARGVGRDIMCRDDFIDTVFATKQQSTYLTVRLGGGQRHDLFDQPA